MDAANDIPTVKQGVDDIQAIEKTFSLTPGFFDSLRKEDDWSVVIKCHSLLESAVSRLLTLYFGNHALDSVFTRLEMSSTTTGKIAFISALGLLGKPQVNFIRKLSDLRNKYAHDITYASIPLTELLQKFDANQRKSVVNSLNIRLLSITSENKEVKGADMVLQYPKLVIWSSTLICLSDVWLESVAAVKRNEIISEHIKGLQKPIALSPKGVSLDLHSGNA